MANQTTQALGGPDGLVPDDASSDAGFESRAALPMHPRDVGQLLDLAVDVFTARFLPLVGAAFVLWLPLRLLLFDDREPDLLFILGIAHSLIAQTLCVAVSIQIVYAHLQGREMGLGAVLITALRRSPALLFTSALIGAVTSTACMCLVAPGVWIMFLWSVVPAALILERVGAVDALSRSQRLVRGSFSRWLGVMVCAMALKLPFDAIGSAFEVPWVRAYCVDELELHPALYTAGEVVLLSLFLAISAAGMAVVTTVYYLDCRVRREGFDLEMRLERLAQGRARAQ